MKDKTSNKSKVGKRLRIALLVLGVAILAAFATLVPTLSPETPGMKSIGGAYVTVYYEREEAAAQDVFTLMNAQSEHIAEMLGFDSPQDIKVYVYDDQSTFQTKKYGLVALLLNMDWYIGDNRGTNVLLTSPANPGSAHTYDSVKNSGPHEMVHAYNSLLNKDMSLWVNEGLALYLANGDPRDDLYSTSYFVPSIEQTYTLNPVEFNEVGGYDFAYTYIEYLDETFGWEHVVSFARTNDYLDAFGEDEASLHDGWVDFLKTNYR